MLATPLSLTLCLLVLAVTQESTRAKPLKEDAKKLLDDKKTELLQKLQDKLDKKKKPTAVKPTVTKPTEQKKPEVILEKKPEKTAEKKPQQHHRPQGHHKPHGGCGPKKHGKGGYRQKSRGKQASKHSNHGGCKRGMKKGSTNQGGHQRNIQDGHHQDTGNYGAIQHFNSDHHY